MPDSATKYAPGFQPGDLDVEWNTRAASAFSCAATYLMDINKMNRLVFFAGMICAVTVLAGCNVMPKKADPALTRPAWIENPGIGVSASAAWNPRGRAAQEEMAIARGRTEIARRAGVNVTGETASSTSVIGNKVSTEGSVDLTVKVDQKDVKAVVKEKWHDVANDTIWVWVMPSK